MRSSRIIRVTFSFGATRTTIRAESFLSQPIAVGLEEMGYVEGAASLSSVAEQLPRPSRLVSERTIANGNRSEI
jgi:hypothetical protein